MGERQYTAAEKLAAAKRELALRQRKYPEWVAAGRLREDVAEREIGVMAAIVRDYEQDVETARRQADLFGGSNR